VLLGVDSDADLDVAGRAEVDECLHYRASWDVRAEERTARVRGLRSRVVARTVSPR
jgi:hypothetical protein